MACLACLPAQAGWGDAPGLDAQHVGWGEDEHEEAQLGHRALEHADSALDVLDAGAPHLGHHLEPNADLVGFAGGDCEV